MPNYVDTENPKVKEFWDLHAKSDKKFTQFFWVGVVLFLFIEYLSYNDKLTTNALLLFVIAGLFALGWLINIETQILHKRIDIIDEAFDKDKSERVLKEFLGKE